MKYFTLYFLLVFLLIGCSQAPSPPPKNFENQFIYTSEKLKDCPKIAISQLSQFEKEIKNEGDLLIWGKSLPDSIVDDIQNDKLGLKVDVSEKKTLAVRTNIMSAVHFEEILRTRIFGKKPVLISDTLESYDFPIFISLIFLKQATKEELVCQYLNSFKQQIQYKEIGNYYNALPTVLKKELNDKMLLLDIFNFSQNEISNLTQIDARTIKEYINELYNFQNTQIKIHTDFKLVDKKNIKLDSIYVQVSKNSEQYSDELWDRLSND